MIHLRLKSITKSQ